MAINLKDSKEGLSGRFWGQKKEGEQWCNHIIISKAQTKSSNKRKIKVNKLVGPVCDFQYSQWSEYKTVYSGEISG